MLSNTISFLRDHLFTMPVLAAGQRLLDDRMLNVVLVLVFATSVLGPVLTERFASRLTAGTPDLNSIVNRFQNELPVSKRGL